MNKLKQYQFRKYSSLFLMGLILQALMGLVAGASEHNKDASQNNPTKEFFYHIKIYPEGDSSLQQLILTEDIYQHSQHPSLSDLIVVDSLGEPVPFEITTSNNKVTHHKQAIMLYSLSEPRNLLEKTDTTLFKYDQENRLSEIQSNNSVNNKNQVAGYLLDLGERNVARNSRLNFTLSEITRTSFLRFDIDQSNDLKRWSSVTKGEVLAQLFHEQAISQHNQIDITGINARYLRIKLLDQSPAFSIKSVTQEFTEQDKTPLVWSEQKEMLYNESEQGFVMTLSPAVSYSLLQVELPNTRSLLKGRLYFKRNNQSNWISRNAINLFHLKDGNNTISKDKVVLNQLVANQIKISLDFPSSGSQSEALKVKLAWAPQKLMFFANGNSPYEVVVGKHESLKASVNHQPILSMIKSQVNGEIAIATFGKSKLVEVKKVVKEEKTNWRKIGLWFILIVGVILMAWMAKRLLKQVDTTT